MTSRVVLDEFIEDIAAKGASAEDGKKFERDYCWIRVSPTSVGFRIFFP